MFCNHGLIPQIRSNGTILFQIRLVSLSGGSHVVKSSSQVKNMLHRSISILNFIGLSLFCSFIVFAKAPLSDTEVKQQIIRNSIASYPGNCPCPHSVASNGSSCGRRSAYSKPGGYDPICYPNDVTPEMVRQYRKRFEEHEN